MDFLIPPDEIDVDGLKLWRARTATNKMCACMDICTDVWICVFIYYFVLHTTNSKKTFPLIFPIQNEMELPAFLEQVQNINDLQNLFQCNNLVTQLEQIALQFMDILDKNNNNTLIAKSFTKGLQQCDHVHCVIKLDFIRKQLRKSTHSLHRIPFEWDLVPDNMHERERAWIEGYLCVAIHILYPPS